MAQGSPAELIENAAAHDPFTVFADWYAAAQRSEPNDPNAVMLATAGASGQPSARIVLLKEWDRDGFIFYTHSSSQKGRQLAENPLAALTFHWKSLQRQIRIEGRAAPVEPGHADAYFAGRPRQSQIGAWASEQSQPLDSRTTFEHRLAELEEHFAGQHVPRPPGWTGYRVTPTRLEFWVERPYRLHDRWVFEPSSGDPGGAWQVTRLYP